MDDYIVSVPLEWNAQEIPSHPHVERIMQEEIGEQRTDNPALWRAFRPLFQGPAWLLHGGAEPPCDVETDPRQLSVVRNGALHQFPVQTIKERLDVEIYDPVVTPASLSCSSHRIVRRAPWPIAIGVGMERRLQVRLQDHCHGGLCDSIGNCGN